MSKKIVVRFSIVSLLACGCGASDSPVKGPVHEPIPAAGSAPRQAALPTAVSAPSAEYALATGIPYGNAAARPVVVEIAPDWVQHRAANPTPSAAYAWVDIVLEVTGREVDAVGARPTIISRQMAIPLTAMYDAWAAYDAKAVGTRLGAKLRRPIAERTLQNKAKALSYATYRALVDIFPKDKEWLESQMRKLGYDPSDVSTNPATPQGIGNLAAAAVIDYRHRDGANQLGDETGSDGKPYSDYTYYEPRNSRDKINEPDRWQQIPFDDGHGGKVYPGFLTPHWYRVKPFALQSSAQFRPPPQPKVGSDQLRKEIDEVVAFNGSLSLEQKSIVEFMRDGPRSTGQSGHWMQFAQDVSRRDKYGLDQDVKAFFAIANTAFDAFLASWDAKRFYDSARPYALVRLIQHYYVNQRIIGYLGPGKGFGPVSALQWHPYSPGTFVTPPFPGYVSGHSTVSGACAKMLELLTGNDRFGAYHRHTAGMYTEPKATVAAMQSTNGRPPEGLPENKEVVLALLKFSTTADLAGLSRVMGGYHIQADNIEGLKLGRAVADFDWTRYRAYFEGTAEVRK